MSEQERKNENEVTPEGAVEVNEEDLDQASGGAGFIKKPPKNQSGISSKVESPGQKVIPQGLPSRGGNFVIGEDGSV